MIPFTMERTGQAESAFAGEREDPPMARNPTSVNLDEETIKRLDALIPLLKQNRALVALVGREIKRSAVIRLALLRGLEMLEREART